MKVVRSVSVYCKINHMNRLRELHRPTVVIGKSEIRFFLS